MIDHAAVGELLRQRPVLTLTEIARQLGTSIGVVWRIQSKHFPECRSERPELRGQGRRPGVQERHTAIGELLRDTNLTMGEIARRVGLTREGVRQVQLKYFPDLARRTKTARAEAGEYDDKFLNRSLSDEQVASLLDVSVEHAVELRKDVARRHGRMMASRAFRLEILRILYANGYLWCSTCRLVKCVDEFLPAYRKADGRHMCRSCNTKRTLKYYRNNREHRLQYEREYYAQHRDEVNEYQRRWRKEHRGPKPPVK